MIYQMTNDLLTGNTIIDNEHRQLFDAINGLLDACSKGKGRAQMSSTMTFLEKYIEKHFTHEEQLQQQTRYPDYVRHKQLHDGYRKVVHGIMQELNRTGPSVALVAQVNTNVAGWLMNHIRKEDRKVAAHIQSTGQLKKDA